LRKFGFWKLREFPRANFANHLTMELPFRLYTL